MQISWLVKETFTILLRKFVGMRNSLNTIRQNFFIKKIQNKPQEGRIYQFQYIGIIIQKSIWHRYKGVTLMTKKIKSGFKISI